jgi:hypothetical protein
MGDVINMQEWKEKKKRDEPPESFLFTYESTSPTASLYPLVFYGIEDVNGVEVEFFF